MRRYVESEVIVRDGFHDLWEHCRQAGIPSGHREPRPRLLHPGCSGSRGHRAGRHLRRGNQLYSPRHQLPATPHTWDGCTKWGSCKCVAIWAYQRAGYDIAYVGDGTSDFCPASKADMVFARSHLVEKCDSEGVPCHEFEDFYQVLAHLIAKSESRSEAIGDEVRPQ